MTFVRYLRDLNNLFFCVDKKLINFFSDKFLCFRLTFHHDVIILNIDLEVIELAFNHLFEIIL